MGKWEIVRLGDICDILNGYAFKSEKYTNAGIRVIRITNVQKGFVEDNDPKYYPIKYINEIERYKLFENDLLISLTGNVGRVGLIKKEFLPAALNQRVGCLRIKNSSVVDKNYLFNILNSDFFENECIHNSKGMAQKNMSTEWLKEFILALPPLEIQRKIAETLDAASELLAIHKNQLAELDKLVQSVFYDMFGDPEKNEKGWYVVSLSEAIIVDTKMTSDFDKYADVPHIGIDCIEKNTGTLHDYKLVKDSNLISGKYYFNESHIIYSKIRPNLNKVALPTFEGLCSADSYPLLPIEDKTNRNYIVYILRSQLFLDYILGFSNRTNIPKVNKQQLLGFNLPLPPLQLQTHFAETVQKIEEQKALVQKAIDETQALFDSLMNEYFE